MKYQERKISFFRGTVRIRFKGDLKKQMLRVSILSVVMALSLPFMQVPASSAQGNAAFIQLVRAMESDQTGLLSPVGLAFSARANAFQVTERQSAPGSRDLVKLTPSEEHAGLARIEAAISAPINVTFDNRAGRLLILDNSANHLLAIQEDTNGNLDPRTVTRYDISDLGLQDPQGISFDAARGSLYILDAAGPRIVQVEPGADGSFEGAVTSAIDLSASGLASVRGLASEPSTGNLHVMVPADQRLVELSQSGEILATRDLAEFALRNPQGMVFAPSGDQTDDASQMNLYLADSGPDPDEAQSTGQIVELSMIAPAALPPGTTLRPASLVRIINTSNTAWDPSAPDPSGVDYWPSAGRLVVSDSEVDEMPNYFVGKNVYLSTTSGSLTGTCSTASYTNEPTGVAINPSNNHIFISTDANDKVFEIGLGGDGQYCTGDDSVTTVNVGTLHGITDPEDVAYGNNTIFVAGGIDAEVYIIPLGANGVLGGGDDGSVTHFDTAGLGFTDLEAIGYNTNAGTLFIASPKGTERYLGEVTTTGTLVNAYDLSLMGSGPNKRSDVTFAPGSQNPSIKNIYIASRNVDNNNDPNENDGQIWEISISGSGPAPTFTPTRTPTAGGPTPTRTPTPTVTNTPGSSDLIFADGFESGSFSAWSANKTDSGDLSVSAAVALVGTRGMQAVLDDTVTIFATSDHPNAEPRYRARFYFDPNSITMASGNAHFIFQGFTGTSTAVVRIEFRFFSGAYQVRGRLVNDGSTWINTNWFTISDAAHFIELDWRAATGAGANNGGLTLWIDNAQQANLSGVDNDTRRIDRVRLGAVAGIDAGTTGTYYFDAFESRRQTFIGP